jgi:hypothetical protein
VTCVSPGVSPLPHQTSDAKQGETQHEQLKRRWHFHRGTRDVDGHVGSSRQGHRANNQKHRKDEAYDVLHWTPPLTHAKFTGFDAQRVIPSGRSAGRCSVAPSAIQCDCARLGAPAAKVQAHLRAGPTSPPRDATARATRHHTRPPMQLQVGDRLSDESGEWEVVGWPYTTAGGKNTHVRVQWVNQPGVTEVKLRGSYEKVSVRRA